MDLAVVTARPWRLGAAASAAPVTAARLPMRCGTGRGPYRTTSTATGTTALAAPIVATTPNAPAAHAAYWVSKLAQLRTPAAAAPTTTATGGPRGAQGSARGAAEAERRPERARRRGWARCADSTSRR